jgi:type II secretory pathway pseudopilin PulG
LTLIELVVSIAVLSIGVVGIAFGFSAAERSATITQTQAQLEGTIRHISDYIRSHDQLTYQLCATPATYSVPNPLEGITLNPANPVTAIALSTSATRNGAAVPPLKDCTTQQVAPSSCPNLHTCDWGVQEIKITATSGGRSLTRWVWKGIA